MGLLPGFRGKSGGASGGWYREVGVFRRISRPDRIGIVLFRLLLTSLCLCLLVLPAWSQGRYGQRVYSVAEALRRARNRAEQIEVLAAWKGRISTRDREAMQKFKQEQEYRDWVLWYHTRRILLPPPPPEEEGDGPEFVEPVEQAEQLFLLMEWGGGSDSEFDWSARELAALGSDVIPLFLDLLRYNGEPDLLRKRVAVLGLARLDDPRIVPALREAARTESRLGLLREHLMALLLHDPSEAMTDFVRETIGKQKQSPNDQAWILDHLLHGRVAIEARRRLAPRSEEYNPGGQSSVIRALRAMRDEFAFQELSRLALLERAPGAEGDALFAGLLEALLDNPSGDPCPVVLKALATHPRDLPDSLLLRLGEHQCREAVGLLRREKTTTPARGVLCSGILCKLGVDYESNAATVRGALTNPSLRESAFLVVKHLRDETTIRLLAAQAKDPETDTETMGLALAALGEMDDPAALSALREILRDKSIADYRLLGESIRALGLRMGDVRVEQEGAELLGLAEAVENLAFQLGPEGTSASTEKKAETPAMQRAVQRLRESPAAVSGLIQSLDTAWGLKTPMLLALLDRGWSERHVACLEALMQTNPTRREITQHDTRETDYPVRAAVAEFLSRKTGKHYSHPGN